MSARNKHSSLFRLFVSDEEKGFETLTTILQNFFCFRPKKLDRFAFGKLFWPSLMFAGTAFECSTSGLSRNGRLCRKGQTLQQSDQKFEKNCPIFGNVAKTVTKLQKLKLTVKNSCIKMLLNVQISTTNCVLKLLI
jgi:hypothetical protein